MMFSSRLLVLMWFGALCSAPQAWSRVGDRDHRPVTEMTEDNSATLEEEMDNQVNILTQLLGDYDKVKTVSEGSNCRCKCVVRPLSRSACKRIEEGNAKREDFYTVETVTVGPNCKKCACVAPPSALNPCEGDFRFRKLQEAGNNIKVATIMDVLEGALYGMDLLKLHAVTTKLLERVDNIEKSFPGNGTKERGGVKGEKGPGKAPRVHQRLDKKKRLSELEPSLQKKAAAAFSHTERKYEEKFVGNEGSTRPLLKRSHSEDPEPPKTKNQRNKIETNGMSIRRVTFYKAETVEDEEGEAKATPDDVLSGDGSVDLIIQDQHKLPASTRATSSLTSATVAPLFKPSSSSQKFNRPPPAPNGTAAISVVAATEQPKPEPRETTELTATGATVLVALTTSTTTTTTTTIQPEATNRAAAITGPSTVTKPPSNTTAVAQKDTVKSHLTWDEGLTEAATVVPKNPGVCKDTLATIGDPVTHNTYGRNEGAWMKDPKGNGMVIYVTNYYYGSNLLEFRDMDTFKQGRFSNSYKLPYNWIGTGHVVYNGAFYYNRAFSRDIIRFDLRLRYVAAWTTLHDAVFEEEEAPWRWRGHSDIDFAVDEGGLWMVYPALDEEGFHQEVIVLNKLNPYDLHKENTWRTGLRRNTYGNSFVICGVLYAVDSYERTNANISYAFDTHTHTQMVPRLPFVNNFTYTTQIDYNPKDRMLYAWDNGRQVTYDVIFAY